MAASTAITDFIKHFKNEIDDHFKYTHYDRQSRYRLEAMSRIEDYTSSFIRDMPHKMRYMCRKDLKASDERNAIQTRELMIKRLGMIVDMSQPTIGIIEMFHAILPRVIDDMNSQYLQIRSARKALFDDDTTEPGCDINLELNRCDEMIDWEPPKPDISDITSRFEMSSGSDTDGY